ncbi:MAG: hypothetical protein PHU49_04240 [Syntrophorhabdaceae bacterium]|nr:hypothetical protein [Syntrophorhabdaceae bacterium]MDD5243205.1 hypothetical protein [Syntrophorhabdaceae bacterium]
MQKIVLLLLVIGLLLPYQFCFSATSEEKGAVSKKTVEPAKEIKKPDKKATPKKSSKPAMEKIGDYKMITLCPDPPCK